MQDNPVGLILGVEIEGNCSPQVLHSHPFQHLRFHLWYCQIEEKALNVFLEKELQGGHVQRSGWSPPPQGRLVQKVQQPTQKAI